MHLFYRDLRIEVKLCKNILNSKKLDSTYWQEITYFE
jgi:hypothetical protein